MIAYMIRLKKDSRFNKTKSTLYSKGGINCVHISRCLAEPLDKANTALNMRKFGTRGKMFVSAKDIYNHLRYYREDGKQLYLQETEVVTFKLKDIHTTDPRLVAHDFFRLWPKIVKWGKEKALFNMRSKNSNIRYLTNEFTKRIIKNGESEESRLNLDNSKTARNRP